jgi:BirA family biotin operon repressor/biotin-[acetyl-CoA-carboxylase] ligase
MQEYLNNHDFHILRLDDTGSTNTYLKELSQRKPLDDFTTVVAGYQRSGRGQEGNSWESENGKNLLFSYIISPDFCPANEQFYLSQLISLGIKETLDSYTDGITIKWPNDIYWHDRKICGILIENVLCGTRLSQSIAGIGININQEIFRSDAPNPVSLRQITGKEYELDEVLLGILIRTQQYYTALRRGEKRTIADTYFRALYRRDGLYPYRDAQGLFRARIKDILPSGTLVLLEENGRERHYNFKEVAFVL